MQIEPIGAVAHGTTRFHILLSPEHSRQPAVQCELGKGCALRVGEQRGYNKKSVDAFLRQF